MRDRPPPRLDPNAVLAHVLALVHQHRPEMPAWVATTELTFGQLRLLFRLRRAGPTLMHELATWWGVDPATATGIVERVERHGLVVRGHRDDDRRVVECRLSDAGAALVDEIEEIRLDALREVFALLDPAELAEFDRLVTRVLERTQAASA